LNAAFACKNAAAELSYAVTAPVRAESAVLCADDAAPDAEFAVE